MNQAVDYDPEFLRLIAEMDRRGVHMAEDLLDNEFTSQTAFINDPNRLKAAICTRRSGKSYGCGLYMVQEAINTPGCTVLYVALTRESAKRIMWKDILKTIDRKHKLNIRFQETELAAYFPNGSIIYLVGTDTDENQKSKLLGQKYRLCVVDEAASFGTDLKELVYGVLKPATADYRGTVCLIGTPGNITRGLFYDVTRGNEPGWTLHKWTAFENPYIKDQWAEEIQDIKTNRPLFMDTTFYKQHYLGEWVIDDTKLVYKFRSERNKFQSIPTYVQGDWTYVLGIDLGYDDDSAFVVCSYHDHDPNLYVIETFKQAGMDLTDVSNKVKWFNNKYDISVNIVDGANKQAIAEMTNRHDVALRTADKTGKSDFIELMNAEMTQGRILVAPACKELVQEWGELIWDDSKPRREEHSACPNHLADACLYAWRFCYPYLNTEIKLRPKTGTKEWYDNVALVQQQEAQNLEYSLEEQLREIQEQSGVVREGLQQTEDWS